jgi:hypothetical protein
LGLTREFIEKVQAIDDHEVVDFSLGFSPLTLVDWYEIFREKFEFDGIIEDLIYELSNERTPDKHD